MCYVEADGFKVTSGRENVKQSKFRHFCGECGTRLYNALDSPPKGPRIGFFPATLDEATQQRLPGKFRPSLHNLSNEAVTEIPDDAIPRHVAEE